MFKSVGLSLAVLPLFATAPAVAHPDAPFASASAPALSLNRVSLEARAGLDNLIFPAAVFHVGYRLPLWQDRIEPFISYEPGHALLEALFTPTVLVGVRDYFIPRGTWQPYASLALGYGNAPTSARSNPNVWGFPAQGLPNIRAAVGVNWMPWSNVGLTGSIAAGFPSLLTSMLGVRLNL